MIGNITIAGDMNELQNLIEAWLKFDESKYMALSLHKIGIVEFNKR